MVTIINHIEQFVKEKHYTTKVSDAYGFLKLHDLSIKDMINLCGGLPVQDATNYSFEAEAMHAHVIRVEIQCEQYHTVRTIDFEDKVITNDYMRVNKKGQGIGLFLLINQIKSAQQFDFIKLDVHAAGGEGWTSDWDGYFYWAKAGYTMDDESLETFKEWLAQYGLEEKYQSLNELVKNEDDLELWKEKGFDWDGYFDLHASSINIKFLRDYIQRRKLSIDI